MTQHLQSPVCIDCGVTLRHRRRALRCLKCKGIHDAMDGGGDQGLGYPKYVLAYLAERTVSGPIVGREYGSER